MIIIASYSNVSVTYTADGTQTVFSFPFDYLRKAFVFVEINGETVLEQGTDYNVVDKTVVFQTAPVVDTVLRIYRQTDTTPLVSWADASVLRAKDMTIQQVQELHILEEYQYNNVIAVNTANEAKEIAEEIEAKADEALLSANEAKGVADGIAGTAQEALETANEAKDAVDGAVETANEAKDTAGGIAGTAQEALETANEAKDALPNYLPLAGGTMTGNSAKITMGNGNSFISSYSTGLVLSGDADTSNASQMVLYTKANGNGVLIDAGHGNTRSRLLCKPDGTFTWNGNAIALAKDYLPLTGGTLSGWLQFSSAVGRIQVSRSDTNNDGAIQIYGGSGYSTGAYLWLNGAGRASQAGYFGIRAVADGSNSVELQGRPDGTLTWGGKYIATENDVFTNLKRFGAIGDGITDDTSAWNSWKNKVNAHNYGYVQPGKYLVNGTVKSYIDGCIGNCENWVMTGNPAPDDSYFMNNATNTGPIIQHHRDYSGINSWSPLIDLSFDSVSDRNSPWTVNGAGAQGIQVRGTIKGTGNSHPIGIRSLMLSELNGDGDAVAVWGRAYKNDPTNGTNDSDTCAIHAMCQNNSTGSGLVMATEHWSRPLVNNVASDNVLDIAPGSSVCQHVNAQSDNGMTLAGILINGSADKNYGMYHGIIIGRRSFYVNGNNLGAAETTAINCATWDTVNGYPEAGIRFGYCPAHVRLIGSYTFNVRSNYTKFYNNVSGSTKIQINNNVGASGNSSALELMMSDNPVADIYATYNNVNTFYRNLQTNGSHYFYCKNSSGSNVNCLTVNANVIGPSRDNALTGGTSSLRYKQLYAATSTIATSDERLKDNISDIPDAVLDAWGDVNMVVFQFKDAIQEKGNDARIHTGLIAQQVQKVFEQYGIDAYRYGLLCYDKWDAKEAVYEETKVIDKYEVHDEHGNVTEPEVWHTEKKLIEEARPAGDRYSIRYEEALILEAAYQRRRADRVEKKLNDIEKRLSALETA